MEEVDAKLFNINDSSNTYNTMKYVYEVLDERGYNPVNQIVGYLISGDLGYISSYKDARNIISKLDRNSLVETMFKEYIK